MYVYLINLDDVLINKILVTEFITAKVSDSKFDTNTVNSQIQSTQWNEQLGRYVFFEVVNVWNKTFENKSIVEDHRISKK